MACTLVFVVHPASFVRGCTGRLQESAHGGSRYDRTAPLGNERTRGEQGWGTGTATGGRRLLCFCFLLAQNCDRLCSWSFFLSLLMPLVLARVAAVRVRSCSAVVAPCCACLPSLVLLVLALACSVPGARGRFCWCCSCASFVTVVEHKFKEESPQTCQYKCVRND